MTTCRDIIKTTLRRLGVVTSGMEPSSSQANDGLEALQAHYDGLVASGRLGRLTDILVTASPYDANCGERIAYSGSGTLAINLPETEDIGLKDQIPEKGSDTLRKPYDLAVIVVEGGSTHLYEAGAWVELNGLELSDDAPLSGRFRQWLVGELAIRLADDYGMSAPASCVADAMMGRSAISHKFSAPKDDPVYF